MLACKSPDCILLLDFNTKWNILCLYCMCYHLYYCNCNKSCFWLPPPLTPNSFILNQAVKREMAPEYTDDQDEGKQVCTIGQLEHFFKCVYFMYIYVNLASSGWSQLVLKVFSPLSSCVLTEVQDGWQFRPPPRGVTSSEEYTLCKRYYKLSLV